MTWSKLTMVTITITPFVFWITAITAFWEIYQFEMSLSAFSGVFNTIYFFITSIYFMVWTLLLWEESLVEERLEGSTKEEANRL